MKAFHGTNSKFEKFDYNFMNRMDYGYGFYFTTSKQYAKDYGKYLLTCEIPDEEYYLDFDMSWETSSKEVQYNLMDLYIHYPDPEGKKKLEKYMFSDTLNSGFFIVEILSKLLKGQRNAVEYLRKYNIKGLYSFKGDCYVVFNPDDIKIIKTEINENMSLKYLNTRLERFLEEAAMYQSNQPTFKDFFNYVTENPKCKKCYFNITKPFKVRVPSDTILHDFNKHGIRYRDWLDVIQNLDNILNASISRKTLASSKAPVAIIHIKGKLDYGVAIQMDKNYNQITTVFTDNPNSIDNWVRTSPAGGLSDKPIASLGNDPKSVVQPSQDLTNIIMYIKDKIKR